MSKFCWKTNKDFSFVDVSFKEIFPFLSKFIKMFKYLLLEEHINHDDIFRDKHKELSTLMVKFEIKAIYRKHKETAIVRLTLWRILPNFLKYSDDQR